MSGSTSKTITFDVNKFLTYEDFLKSIYDTMGGEFISTYINVSITSSGQIAHTKKDKFIIPLALENNEDDVFKENFGSIRTDVQYGNGSDEYDDDCFLRLKSLTFYSEPEQETYIINGECLRIFTTHDLISNYTDRIDYYDKLRIYVYDADYNVLGTIIPSDTNLEDGNYTTSKWKYMTYPYLISDESTDWTNKDNLLKWYKLQTYTNIDCSTNVPKYLRIYSDIFNLMIYDNIKHFNNHNSGDIWCLDECHQWTYTYSSFNNNYYYERELDDEDLKLLR